jgi:hypothetical protein
MTRDSHPKGRTLKNYTVRKWVSHIEETWHDGGTPVDEPTIKAAVGVLVANPFVGQQVDDLSPLIDPSDELGTELGKRAVALLGGRAVQSYGKGGIAGIDAEQEHLAACVTTVFGNAFRDAVGGGEAWISSVSKVGAPGASIDVPLAHKDALYVRSHYDAVTFSVADGPKADELFVVVAVSTGPRVHARVGGLRADEITGGGLR